MTDSLVEEIGCLIGLVIILYFILQQPTKTEESSLIKNGSNDNVSSTKIEKVYNVNLCSLEKSHSNKGSVLLEKRKYKEAFEQYLIFLFWQVCGVYAQIEGEKTTYHFFEDAKAFYDEWGGYETHIQFYGNSARCLEYLNLSKSELENMVLNMPLEKGLNFPFTPEELLPYYLKAYDKHIEEKEKFEKEYGIRYMIGGKIN